ncbi:MAG TPA: hypothetical protein VJQ77_04580 [Novosphingobium sp.]|nr:hypothetical protein [Novosphingobium sp.]
MKQKILGLLCLAMLALIPQRAAAYTECTVNLLDIYAGDGGMVWLDYTNGGSGYVSASSSDREAILSLATTALVSKRQVRVRYQADGVACTAAGRGDIEGVYLL